MRARFEFGRNWARFSAVIDDARVREAESSLRSRLGELAGLSFLDVGCGSGLFSLAAVRLGAACVLSFDLDRDSVATADALRRRFGVDTACVWTIERGDVLDRPFLDSLGVWDVVYAWGVLHHTGDLRAAAHNAAGLVAPGGRLFVSVYNDQGRMSRIWLAIKRGYHRLPPSLRTLYVILVMAPRELASATLAGPNAYARAWREYHRNRGMSRWHDLVDWVGGYPFEVAPPEAVFGLYRACGFELEWMRTAGGGLGCNEFIFRRLADSAPPAGRQ